MNAVPKRVENASWMVGNTVRTLVFPKPGDIRTTDAGAIGLPKQAERTAAPPVSISIPFARILKFELPISYTAIVALALALGGVSATATAAGINARDSRLSLENLKSRVGFLEKQLEVARKTPPEIQVSSAILPIESDHVIWVQLPEE
jgi:hypothetical protein